MTMPNRELSVTPGPAFWVAIALYGASAAAYLLSFLADRPGAARVGRALMVLAVASHGFDIGWRGVEHVHPAQSVREALGFLAWIAAVGFLATTWRYRADLAGVVAAPTTLAILAVARLSPAGREQEGLTALGRIHILLAVVGVALFAIATVLSLLYLFEERSLKSKKFDTHTFRRNAAPLESLDRRSHRLVLAGFPVFTIAFVLGVIWVSQRKSGYERPEYGFAVASWITFAALLIARVVYGWRGRRTASMTVLGFAGAVCVLAVYLLRRSYG
jgi:ABC-type uncharacterized transport system permease subunit